MTKLHGTGGSKSASGTVDSPSKLLNSSRIIRESVEVPLTNPSYSIGASQKKISVIKTSSSVGGNNEEVSDLRNSLFKIVKRMSALLVSSSIFTLFQTIVFGFLGFGFHKSGSTIFTVLILGGTGLNIASSTCGLLVIKIVSDSGRKIHVTKGATNTTHHS
jgi:hypothetical protein